MSAAEQNGTTPPTPQEQLDAFLQAASAQASAHIVDPGNAFPLAAPVPDVAVLSTASATLGTGQRVLIATVRVGGTTLTLKLPRETAIAWGRQLVKGGQELGGLIVPAPGVHP